MQSVLKIAIAMSLFASMGFSVEISVDKNEDAKVVLIQPMSASASVNEIQRVKIKDDGIERSIFVPKSKSSDIVSLSPNVEDKLNSKNGLLVRFEEDNVTIEPFETLFGIKFKEKLKSGFYIFENQSELTDIALIEMILKSDSAGMIQTLRPNWKMGVTKF